MNCIVAIEERFTLRDGKPASPGYSYERFWRRYLEVFESVIVVGRLSHREDLSAVPIEGKGVRFFPLPTYIGPWQYLQNLAELKRKIKLLLKQEQKAILILRLPGIIGGLIWGEIHGTGRPYAVEVVGDPFDVFAPGVVSHPLRPFFRWLFTCRLKQQCIEASAVSYVTEASLQRRYPPSPGAFSTYYSDIYLNSAFFASTPKTVLKRKKDSYILITVGSMAQLYKGQDVLIKAVAMCVAKELDLHLVLIGDGRYRKILEKQSKASGLSERVSFLGQLQAGESVQRELDRADLFILPSRTEGLPRAMIEAMARGLPCIGSAIGGIPELLPPEDLVSPDDAAGLAGKIQDVVTNPERMAHMAARNLEKAHEYREEMLRNRRVMFYQKTREIAERWLDDAVKK
ncbi:MAG: glycosyltransferase family 4 protein [bacterium]